MFETILENVRRSHPLVHSITNYVTANDCANLLLACGASPIMADDPGEAPEITARCAGLYLNLGTLQQGKIPSFFLCGHEANRLNLPIVLDPVGVGSSTLRTSTALRLLQELHPTVSRGNRSEIKALASGCAGESGVDAAECDQVTEDTLADAAAFVKRFAARTGAVVAMTGAIDIIADGQQAYCVRNGHPMMAFVTGAGCQLSALTAAFVSANPHAPLLSAVAAACAMGLAGEIAHSRLAPLDGSAAYRGYLIDAIYNLTPQQLEAGSKREPL